MRDWVSFVPLVTACVDCGTDKVISPQSVLKRAEQVLRTVRAVLTDAQEQHHALRTVTVYVHVAGMFADPPSLSSQWCECRLVGRAVAASVLDGRRGAGLCADRGGPADRPRTQAVTPHFTFHLSSWDLH